MVVSISHWGAFVIEGCEGSFCRHMDCLRNGKSYSYLLWLSDF